MSGTTARLSICVPQVGLGLAERCSNPRGQSDLGSDHRPSVLALSSRRRVRGGPVATVGGHRVATAERADVYPHRH